ncbi:hypothetical protein [Streptosporangium roseum]|uniref:Uncharacterized protein n=1 Tax=Streptosporangium roseum (strain ATCC 12428 / DSM 43021 / JCM 3005 / KCTC 9067 / NCIMB 10171 / NRRL 2505 / NI 9100) TaxID=479432 RepID=D2B1H1_STRRD|nr:hypothetical protein [Streptosporangium roseum]ACZ85436.1 hypothetical protein Sros_2460 [Streptosporangium roseum DSM 43021]
MRIALIPEHTSPLAAADGVDADGRSPAADVNPPEDVAATVVPAPGRPVGCEHREMVACPATETSWP